MRIESVNPSQHLQRAMRGASVIFLADMNLYGHSTTNGIRHLVSDISG